MTRSRARSWVSAATLLAASAGESPAAQESVLFQTATVVARPLVEATASVTVLDRETIEALGVDTVAELIRFVPGLDLVTGGPRGGLAVAQVRGGDPNFTVVLLDGVPLNDPTDLLRGGAVNLNGLSTALVERIEVVRGPLSSFFGSAALGGAINVITRQGPADGRAAALELAAGDASMRQGAASWSAGAERHDEFVGAAWAQEEGRAGDDTFEQLDVRGNFRADVGERSKLRVGGRVATWDTDDYPDLSGGPVYGSGDTRHSEHDELQLGAEWTTGAPERPHRVSVVAYRHDLGRDTPVTPVAPAFVEDTRYTRWRVGWSAPVLAGRRVRLNAGAELDREEGQSDTTLDFGGPFPDSYRMDRTTGGAFMELLAERGPALIEVGARIDVPQGFDTEISPRVGASFKLGDGGTRVRLSAGRGFKLPSFFVLGSSPVLGGNPDLDPERVWGFDAGVERRFAASGLTAGVTLFQDDYEDLIDFVPADTVPGCVPPPGGVTACNRADVRARGAELSVGWASQTRFQIQVGVTRQEVEDRQTDQPLRNRPDWIAAAHATWRPCDRARWTVDGQWASESLDFVSPFTGGDSTAGYQLYGTALEYDVRGDLKLRARVDNLADKEYETFIGFAGPGRGFSLGLRWSVD